jgi:CHAT domain-containing protein/Flp pilus assembly protein TadD
LSREQGNLLAEAGALDRRGTALKRLGRLKEALVSYQGALEVFQRSGQPGSAAHTLANLGWLFEARGEPRTAVSYGERALQRFQELGDRHAEAYTLLGIARAERRLGNLEAARARIEEALGILESLRGEAPIQALRTTYLASRHDYYEFAVDLLMELGLAARAWEVAERARARSLLESVGEGKGAQPLDEDLRRLVLAGGEIRSRLRDGGAGAAAASLGLREVQRQVLDGDTLLLQYALGSERSFLWIVGADAIESFALPGRRRIEELARRAYGLLPRSHQRGVRQQARLALATLSDAILGPAARRLDRQRLLIVADGALQYIPFAALPVVAPDGRRAPLLAEHEVVSLPSASVLARLRRERLDRLPSPHLVAVIADPVFQRSDPRVKRGTVVDFRLAANLPAAAADEGERSAGGLGLDGLARLPHTRREAAAILDLVPAGESLAALDFAASRELVLSGRLRRYRIVHFATHGLLDSARPGRSGLVLSRVDERGRPRDGFLGVHEIHGLDLRADLVVLSACRTALGREIWGEGLLGLTQAFLQAGAGRVMVSLWNVDDAAAAELMSRFYRGLLRQRLSPSRALRAAQLALSKEPRWEAPYYWAGFSLLGDWQ